MQKSRQTHWDLGWVRFCLLEIWSWDVGKRSPLLWGGFGAWGWRTPVMGPVPSGGSSALGRIGQLITRGKQRREVETCWLTLDGLKLLIQASVEFQLFLLSATPFNKSLFNYVSFVTFWLQPSRLWIVWENTQCKVPASLINSQVVYSLALTLAQFMFRWLQVAPVCPWGQLLLAPSPYENRASGSGRCSFR